MPKRFSVTRRDLLRTSLGALLLAPLLRERELEAQAMLPKRLVILFTPDSHPPEWWPNGSGSSFELQEPLADFKGLESQMLFLRRLDHQWTYDNHHEAGMAQLFTGAKFFDEATHHANGPSIDQILLQKTEIRGGTPIASIHLCSAARASADKRHVLSYSGPGQPISHQAEPAKAFAQIFNGVNFGTTPATPAPSPTSAPIDTALVEAKRNIDRRIVQVNTAELKAMQGLLGQVEREKLERHVEALFEIEKRLASLPPPTDSGSTNAPTPTPGTCAKTDTSGYNSSLTNATSITAWSRMQADLIVNAFACDRTRIADYGFSFSGGHHEGLLGFKQSWHDLVAAHVSKSNDSVSVDGVAMSTRDAFIKFDRFFAGQVAYLARRLAETAEGNGSMLDNTIMLWGVESGTNHNHSPRDMQYLVIGGKNLGVNVGQYVNNTTAQSSNKLLVSVMNALGYPATGIGIEPNCGTLAEFFA
jgi:hypothetical protein